MSITNTYVKDLDREYVFHSWSVQGALNPLVIAGGEGCTVWDYEGKRYLDAYNNVVSLGHCHPHVVQALQRQAWQQLQQRVAVEHLAALAPGGVQHHQA